MGKVKIVDIRERTKFVSPDKSISVIDVTFETEKGYRGTVHDLPADATEDAIWAAVERAAKTPEKMIGLERGL